MKPPAAILETLARNGQEHVLDFWDRLDDATRRSFVAELESVDWTLFGEMRRLAAAREPGSPSPQTAGAADLTAAITPPCLRLGGTANPIAREAAVKAGAEALRVGRIGAILVAGGQGTRLGCQGPKGLYRIGPVSGANLFELLFGGLVAVRRRYGTDVPLAVMTSSATDTETRAFLDEHAYCGLDPAKVFVFRQHDLPAIDAATGRLLLDGPGHLALAPDGHGGMLVALAESGGLEWFRQHGVDQVASFQVDNPLALPLAAEFLGYHLLSTAELSTQVVEKREPGERVGVVVDCGGRHSIVEYSDLPADAAAERMLDGRLRFHAGSIAVHCFTRDFLERTAARDDSLPLHLAFKALPALDAEGVRRVPTKPNAIKFERFIFDLMPLARRVCVVEVDPAEAFAPLKNPPGAPGDAPEHVQAALIAHARRLLARVGVGVADGVAVELAADRIIDEADIPGSFPPGTVVATPTVIGR